MLRSLTLPVLYRRSRHIPVHAFANRSNSLSLLIAGSFHHTTEIRRLIRTAAPFETGYLRIRAKRARAQCRSLRRRALPFRGDDRLRRDALFHPAFERQRQALVGFSAFAQQNSRIEAAFRRIIQHAVGHSITRVASREHGGFNFFAWM